MCELVKTRHGCSDHRGGRGTTKKKESQKSGRSIWTIGLGRRWWWEDFALRVPWWCLKTPRYVPYGVLVFERLMFFSSVFSCCWILFWLWFLHWQNDVWPISMSTTTTQRLMQDFAGLHFRADIALERAKLEDGLLGFIQQMLSPDVFCLAVGWRDVGGLRV